MVKGWASWPGKAPSHPEMLSFHRDRLPSVELRSQSVILDFCFSLPPSNQSQLLSIPLSLTSLKSLRLSPSTGLLRSLRSPSLLPCLHMCPEGTGTPRFSRERFFFFLLQGERPLGNLKTASLRNEQPEGHPEIAAGCGPVVQIKDIKWVALVLNDKD